jgi:hypothetical protein
LTKRIATSIHPTSFMDDYEGEDEKEELRRDKKEKLRRNGY